MSTTFFQSAWGKVRLWLSNISTSDGRKQVVKEYTRGDLPDVQDRGKVPRRTRCSILFDMFPSDPIDPIDRLEMLIAEVADSATTGPKLFAHPIYGTYLAAIEDFDHTIDDSGTIAATATFIATEDTGVIFTFATGISQEIDADALNNASDFLDSQLADFGLTTKLTSQARSLADQFQRAVNQANDQIDAQLAKTSGLRNTLVGVASISDQLWAEQDRLQVTANTAMWPVFRAYVLLGEAVRSAAVASTPQVESLITVRVDGAMSLWSLLTKTYGARKAPARRGDVMALNSLKTPARIPSGTILVLPRP